MLRRKIVVPVLIATNLIVYALWSVLDLEFMVNNFTVSFSGLTQGRYWTLVSSEFSHNSTIHLAMNMFVLNSFGTLMELVLGRGRFLRFYFGAAVVASLCHCLVSNLYLAEPAVPAVGASGAIVGLLMLFALMFPREKILLFFVIPLPALIGALALVGMDIWGLVAQAGGGGLPIGHGAHLGGALSGLLYYLFAIRPKWRTRTSTEL